jgi:hypothetical protein
LREDDKLLDKGCQGPWSAEQRVQPVVVVSEAEEGDSDGREAGIGLPEVALALPALQSLETDGKSDVVKKGAEHEFEAGTASLMSTGTDGRVGTGAVAEVPGVVPYRS